MGCSGSSATSTKKIEVTSGLNALFQPITVGGVELKNRIFLAPLTRSRSVMPDRVPNEMNALYYSQRASGGLLIAEATLVEQYTSAFLREPGIYSDAQVAGWKKVTDAVHKAGSKIALQIYHSGRSACDVCNLETEASKKGFKCVAPSAIAISAQQPLSSAFHPEHARDYQQNTPKELTDEEIKTGIIPTFVKAAQNAVKAGFDFIEVHAANAYLLASFISDRANKRTTGPYSGASIENRCRLALDVIDAIVAAGIPASKIGIRLSPLNQYGENNSTDAAAVTEYISAELNKRAVAYIHLMRGDFFGPSDVDLLGAARKVVPKGAKTVIVSNMGYDGADGNAAVQSGSVDAIAYGTKFLANPDLPERFAVGAELNNPDPKLFYSAGPEGYTDYPTLAQAAAKKKEADAAAAAQPKKEEPVAAAQ